MQSEKMLSYACSGFAPAAKLRSTVAEDNRQSNETTYDAGPGLPSAGVLETADHRAGIAQRFQNAPAQVSEC